jgi:16S rRNA (cytidine1402-2'-O)-methyltransferase
MGNRKSVLCREMTKLYEEILRGPVKQVIATLNDRHEIKGECTLLVEGCREKTAISREELRNQIKKEMNNKQSLSDISKTIARRYGLSRRAVYEEALSLKDE